MMTIMMMTRNGTNLTKILSNQIEKERDCYRFKIQYYSHSIGDWNLCNKRIRGDATFPRLTISLYDIIAVDFLVFNLYSDTFTQYTTIETAYNFGRLHNFFLYLKKIGKIFDQKFSFTWDICHTRIVCSYFIWFSGKKGHAS